MKKLFFTFAGLLTITALYFISGCSSDLPSSPDMTSATAGTATAVDMKDMLIGYYGERPYAALQNAGATIKREYKHLPIVSVSVPTKAIDGLRNNPNILYVEEVGVRHFCEQILDWGVDRIDAEISHTSGNSGAGVNVAVIDSGGDIDHPDLTWAGGYSVVTKDTTEWDDVSGHGTHCAGIISADNNDIGVVGVAPECNIYAVRTNRSNVLLLDDIVAAFDWCIGTHADTDPDNDIQIMSMSFSGGYSEAEYTACQEAYNLGILMVAAAGNDASAVRSPANYATVMAISASTVLDAIATYSNFGPEIELIAPGSAIYSTYKSESYVTMSGTSMACPMVAGAAALAWSANPEYTRDQIRDLLRTTAEDLGLAVELQGSGLVDAEAVGMILDDENGRIRRGQR